MIRKLNASLLVAALLLSNSTGVFGQQATPPPAAPAPAATASGPDVSSPEAAKGSAITEEQIRARLQNKLLFLRGLYLGDNLAFNEHGGATGNPQVGSFTLCGIQIRKVHLTKKKLELEGDRIGLHFFGALPYEDDTKPYDMVKITPKKKVLRISVDRELVVIPKAKKGKKGDKNEAAKPESAKPEAAPAMDNAKAELPDAPAATTETAQAAPAAAEAPAGAPEAPAQAAEASNDPNSVTTTQSPAHSAQVLSQALDNIFSDGLDEKMMAKMPEYWQHYFRQKAQKRDFQPADPNVLRVGGDVKAPKILNSLEPGSNEYAQQNAITGISLYRTIVQPDGRPSEVAIARPIGFGLDERAVNAIMQSHFTPATKDGRAVPVMVDLVVTFRIFSKRTMGTTPGAAPAATTEIQTGVASAGSPAATFVTGVRNGK